MRPAARLQRTIWFFAFCFGSGGGDSSPRCVNGNGRRRKATGLWTFAAPETLNSLIHKGAHFMARPLHMPVPLMLARLRPIALALTAALALVYCASLLAPQGYVAKARVLLPGERMLKLEETAGDPALAKERVRARLQRYAGGMVIDEPAVLPQRHGVTLPLSLAALIGLGIGFAVVATRERR